MEQIAIIRHRAGLIVRLIDTATGQEISQVGTRFWRDNIPISPVRQAEGKFVFLDFPAQDCTFSVKAERFLRQDVSLSRQFLHKQMPLVEVHLVPDESYASCRSCDTIQGTESGIEQIDAVRLTDTACLIQNFDDKRSIITLFNPHHLTLDRTYYAVVNPDVCRYEPIEITEQCNGQKFRIAAPLRQSFGNYFPVARRVQGTAQPSGRYEMRLPNNASDRKWLVRWRKDGKDYFQTVDFALPDTIKLRSPPEERTDADVKK